MLGRTNVMQRKEPTINGVVQNFVVKSGSVISKGDFVSYTLQTDSKQVENIATVYDKRKLSDNVYLVQSFDSSMQNYFLRIVSVGQDLQVEDTISFGSLIYYDVDTQGRVYVGNGTTVSVYDVSNLSFNLIGTATVSRTIIGTLKLNSSGQFGVVTKEFNSSNSRSNVYLQIITVGQSSIELTTEELVLSNVPTATSSTIFYTNYLSDDYFVMVWSYPYAGSASGYVYAQKCQYLNGTFSSERQSLRTLYSASEDLQIARFNGGLLKVKIGNTTNVYYLVQGTLTAISLPTGVTAENLYPCDEEYYINLRYSAGYYSTLCKWDNTNKVMIKGQQTTSYDEYRSDWFKCAGDTLIQFMYSESEIYFWMFDEVTLDLTKGYFSNVVEEYNGNYTVGFAKTGGIGGDTIQVYVPQTSS